MKPRIRRYQGRWWCIGFDAIGVDDTPAEAYWNWRQARMEVERAAYLGVPVYVLTPGPAAVQ